MLRRVTSASPVVDPQAVSDSDRKDDPLLGDTVTPGSARALEDPDSFTTTHQSGEKRDPTLDERGPVLNKGEPIDRYVVLDQRGRGGMGEVYAAWDPVLDRKVALKVLKAEYEGAGKLADELRLRLMREAQSLAKVNHPGVVTVHDVGIVEGKVYVAMEFVEGQSLTEWLREKKRSWREVLEMFLETGEGLAAAHEAGVTHRDFKPDNVIISRAGRPRVMDFGLAHSHSERTQAPKPPSSSSALQRKITSPGIMLGTPAYMSPEAMYGRPTDPRSDEFSFAVALFEALYGVRPFEGNTAFAVAAEIEQQRVKPPPRASRVPRRIHQILAKALRPNPDERFQTLRALLIQLGRRKGSRRRRVLAVVGLVAAVVAIATGLWSWRRERLRCAGFASRLSGVWDERARGEARQAFTQTALPFADGAFSQTRRLMDAWGDDWVRARRVACESTEGKPDEQVGQTIVCLSRRLADFDATAQLFRKADAEIVERAVGLATALPPLASCQPGKSLVQTPEDDSLRQGLAGARALIDAGKLKEARERISIILREARAREINDALAEATWLEARLAAAELDFVRADALAEDAILLAQQHQSDEIAARAWVDRVGFAGISSLDLEEAERWARYARVALNRYGAPRELEASLTNNEAILRARQGRHEEALDGHRRALSLREAVFGPQSPLAARSHNNIGIALRSLKRPSEAIVEFEKALAIEEHALAPDHPAVADTLNNLANALSDRGDTGAAVAALTRSLAIREKTFGLESAKVAQSLSNLGALLLDADRPDEALQSLERALVIKERASPTSLTVAVTLTNLATAQRRVGQLTAAVTADERALAIRRKALGERSPELARNLTGLGATRLLQGTPTAARALLEQALDLTKPGSVERGDAAFLLAKTLPTRDGRRRALLIEALACWPKVYGSRDEAKALLESR